MKMKKLIQKQIVSLQIDLLSGLHIGDSKERMEIGGVDNLVVRRKDNNQPYIPGSSIKGKFRSLLKRHHGELDDSTKPNGKVSNWLGSAANKDVYGPDNTLIRMASKFIFRDSYLTKESVQLLESRESYLDLEYTEIKYETAIDLLTGKAKGGTLRQTERVPAGVSFLSELVIDIYEGDKLEDAMDLLKKGIELLNADYLGKSGSRGYGHVKVKIVKSESI